MIQYRYKHRRMGIEGTVNLTDGTQPTLTFLDPRVEYREQAGWHVASCRVLGLVGCGSTRENAYAHLKEVIETHLRGILHRAKGSPEAAIEALGADWEVAKEEAEVEENETELQEDGARIRVVASLAG